MSNEVAPRFLLNAGAAAEALAIGRTKFYELVKAGTVPAPAHVGRRAVWSADAIEKVARRLVGESQ